jgi:hypothetical protein
MLCDQCKIGEKWKTQRIALLDLIRMKFSDKCFLAELRRVTQTLTILSTVKIATAPADAEIKLQELFRIHYFETQAALSSIYLLTKIRYQLE